MKNAFFATILTMAALGSHSVYANEIAPEISPDIKKVGQARLSLAEQLIEALDAGLVCDTDAYPAEISQLVSSASMQLDQVVIEDWAAALPATSIIRGDFAFRQTVKAIEMNTSNLAAITRQLEGTTFHSFGMGAYGSHHKVILGKAGIAVFKDLELLESEPWTKWNFRKGTWNLFVGKKEYPAGSKRYVDIVKIKIDGTEFEFDVKQGEYWLVPTNVPELEIHEKTLSSSDSYCEA